MFRPAHLSRLALVLSLGLATSGCANKIETPIGGFPGPPTNFTLPDSTLRTLQRAVHERSTMVYGQCFADTALEQRDFHATFDATDLLVFEQGGGAPPQDWTRAQEISFFPQFVAYLPNHKYDVQLSLDTGRGGIVDVGGPTQERIYHEHYRVWSGVTPVCAGSAALTFERVGGSADYKITYWADTRDTVGVRTWGIARLNGR